MTEHVSDERLNAYLDGELELEECLDILKAGEHDARLRARIANLRATRALYRDAYRTPPAPPARPRARRLRPTLRATLVLTLLTGLVFGWGVGELSRPTALVELARASHTAAAQQDGPLRVMVHVTSADPKRLKAVLRETEQLLADYDAADLRVEILTNGPGLRLLEAGASPQEAHVRALQAQHKNLAFLACRKALARVERETGAPLPLVDGTATVRSAFSQIVKRQREGWTYLQI